ncbi:MAG TPA: ParA family partition ATPase [Candidatus Sulfotelmatobacter sp.]|nr:ParA family partition ATPase [Candidatus Sulfotelmatobacter sp.]
MTATVLTVAQQKGGAGKSTLAIHLAVAWSGAGRKVAIVDIDPQASVSHWDERRGGNGNGELPHVVKLSGWRTAGEVERLGREHDIVLIDSPPHADTDARIAVRAAQLVLVPMQPSLMDLWATQATLDMAKSERKPALIVLNRVPPRSRAAEEVAGEVANIGVPLAGARIGNRVALASALHRGKGITEYEATSTAAHEIEALAKEILDRIG